MSSPYGARAADLDRPVGQEIQGVIETKRASSEGRRTTILAGGSVLGAIAMSSCCIPPLVLFSLGVTGAWIGGLASMYPYKWIFFAVTAGFLGGGFYLVYRAPAATHRLGIRSCVAPVKRISNVSMILVTRSRTLPRGRSPDPRGRCGG